MASVDIGERIRILRKKAGLNQDQLAELSLLNRVTIAKYESGRVEPGAKALSRIADALGISVDEILGRDESSNGEQSDTKIQDVPKTPEARIVSGGMDKLPKEQREQILNVVRAMFAQHPELFEKGDEDDA